VAQGDEKKIELAKAAAAAAAARAMEGVSGQDTGSNPTVRTHSGLKGSLEIWILPFTRLHQIPVFKRVWLYIFLMAGYTFFVDWFADRNFPTHLLKEVGGAAYLSVILGLLLVFRTNSANERWWEGRRLWGQLVNDSRNFCLKMRAINTIPMVDKITIAELVISFAYALKHHLRDSRPTQYLPGIGRVDPSSDENVPVAITTKIYDTLMGWRRSDKIDGFTLLQLDTHARAFMDICGACERIKNTPLALSYRAFMRQGIALNLIALPWYIAPEVDLWWSMPVILIGSYFLIGIELIAEDIEDPFGTDGDDLPLDQICSNIKKTVGQILPVEEQQQYTVSLTIPRVDPLKDLT